MQILGLNKTGHMNDFIIDTKNLQTSSNKTLFKLLDSKVLQQRPVTKGVIGFLKNNFMHFFISLTVLSLHSCAGFSLAVANGS